MKLIETGKKMKVLLKIIFAMVIVSVVGCTTLEKPKVTRNDDISKYKYVSISNTGGLNPSSMIEGILLKKGFTSIDEIRPEIIDKTLIVKYGNSGRRDVFTGYTLEATISLINAKTYEKVYTCTAEGQGCFESDDIREAITRCLSDL